MSPTPFTLPEGLSIALGGNSLVIRHTGDVVLEQALGRRLSRLDAEGDVTLRFGPITGAVTSGGILRCDGVVEAEELRADEIHLGPTSITAHAIVATRRVVIAAATLDVDVIVAPEVIIDPAATGRVRVIDCFNERPPLRVRGCLSLAEFEQDFGGAAEFLAARGVIPISQLPEGEPYAQPHHEGTDPTVNTTPAPPPPRHAAARGAPRPISPAYGFVPPGAAPPTAPDGPITPPPSVPVVEAAPSSAAPHPHSAPPAGSIAPASAGRARVLALSPARRSEDAPTRAAPGATHAPVRKPLDLPAEEPKSAPQPAIPERPPFLAMPAESDAPMTAREIDRQTPRIRRIVQRVVSSYEHPPPAVLRLESLVRPDRIQSLPEELNALWIELLRTHRVEGSQPPPWVPLSMNALRALVFG